MNSITAQQFVAYILLAAMLQFNSLRVVALTQAESLTIHGGLPLPHHHSDTPRSTVRQSDAVSGINLTRPTTSTRRPTDAAKPSQSPMPNGTTKHSTVGSLRFTTAFTAITTSTCYYVQQDNTDADTDTDTVTETDTDTGACTRAFDPFEIGERGTVPTSCFSLDPISPTDGPNTLSSLPDVSSQDPSPALWTTFDTPIPASDLTHSIPTTELDSRSNITSTSLGMSGANSTAAMNATMVPGLLPTVTFTTTICLW